MRKQKYENRSFNKLYSMPGNIRQTSNLTICSPPPLSIFSNRLATHPYNTRVVPPAPVPPPTLLAKASLTLFSGAA